MEAHRNMVDGLEVWRQQDAILLAMTNTVDYDQEAYAQLLEEMVREKQEVLADLALKAKAFRYLLPNFSDWLKISWLNSGNA